MIMLGKWGRNTKNTSIQNTNIGKRLSILEREFYCTKRKWMRSQLTNSIIWYENRGTHFFILLIFFLSKLFHLRSSIRGFYFLPKIPSFPYTWQRNRQDSCWTYLKFKRLTNTNKNLTRVNIRWKIFWYKSLLKRREILAGAR